MRGPCAWCDGQIPETARRDSRFCGKRCRQAAWRFTRPELRAHRRHAGEASRSPARATRQRVVQDLGPRRFAYADPPYPGNSERLYGDHPDYAGEVDHEALISRLNGDYPDGWALSTSSAALREVLALCPPDVRIGAWTFPAAPTYTRHGRRAWEPVIFYGGRPRPPGSAPLLDWVHAAPPRRFPGQLVGIKPSAFSWWLFENLGALPGDTLDDLFPGSGAVTRAWSDYQTSHAAGSDASRDAGSARHVAQASSTRRVV